MREANQRDISKEKRGERQTGMRDDDGGAFD